MTTKFKGPKKQAWGTPQAFFEFVEIHLGIAFDLDVCAIEYNAKCRRFFSPEQDAFLQLWTGRAWCNPPYNKIDPWLEKGLRHFQAGELEALCYLLPAR